MSVGIGVTAAGTSVGAIGNGTNWKFNLQWSTAAGGGGSFNIGTIQTNKESKEEKEELQQGEILFNPNRYKDRPASLNVIQEAFSTGSTVSSALAGRRYSEYFGTWTGKNGKLYDMKFNGNGYTGGKYKFAKSLAMKINKIAKALEILDLVIYGRDVYENGEFGINESVESSVKAFSILRGIYGFSFGIG